MCYNLNMELDSKYFVTSEFRCKCGCKDCIYHTDADIANKIDPKLLKVLDSIRADMGKPIVLNSGLRCELHDDEKDKKVPGSHYHGFACDIAIHNYTEIEQLKLLYLIAKNTVANSGYIAGVGTGKSFFHIDTSNIRVAYWSY